ncbi:VEX1-like protein [Mya arenaria]|uniref:VEX1-like protein n=1 Tax=Mya arenaria TaxID=6604 RepID=A0ABY7FKS5_MYAAR|nr:VEX1-like protein [Mya arenaria]
MLPPTKQSRKRQSFSIDSLAVSSHLEPAREAEHARDTDSPYLNYLSTHVMTSADADNNANRLSRRWMNYQDMYNVNDVSLRIDEGVERPFVSSERLSDSATSTPLPQPKRRRLESASTSPSSSDESTTELAAMMTDDNSNQSYPTLEKASPTSGSNCSVSSDCDNESTCSTDSSERRKKARTAFTSEQLQALERQFRSRKYLTASDRTQLAKKLKLREQQVKTWFQNRRMKEKRQERDDEEGRKFHLPTGGVDVSQLAALGICPPPFHLATSSPPATYSPQLSPADQDRRQSAVFPRDSRIPSPGQYTSHPSRPDTIAAPSAMRYANMNSPYAVPLNYSSRPNSYSEVHRMSPNEPSLLHMNPGRAQYSPHAPFLMYPSATSAVGSVSPISPYDLMGSRS